MAAYNSVIKDVVRGNPAIGGLPYVKHPGGLIPSPNDWLRQWGKAIAHDADLGDQYGGRVAAYEALPTEELQAVVSGKFVLKVLRERSPSMRRGAKPQKSHFLDVYMSVHPQVPADLDALVRRLLT